jgi:hypothetical protein
MLLLSVRRRDRHLIGPFISWFFTTALFISLYFDSECVSMSRMLTLLVCVLTLHIGIFLLAMPRNTIEKVNRTYINLCFVGPMKCMFLLLALWEACTQNVTLYPMFILFTVFGVGIATIEVTLIVHLVKATLSKIDILEPIMVVEESGVNQDPMLDQ